VLGVSPQTVRGALKKMEAVNQCPPIRPGICPEPARASRRCADERWSLVRPKKAPRWRWWVGDAGNGQVVAFGFGRRTHATFRRLLAGLEAGGRAAEKWFTAAWGAKEGGLPARQRQTGKAPVQRLARRQLVWRSRLKRRTRQTSCFAKK